MKRIIHTAKYETGALVITFLLLAAAIFGGLAAWSNIALASDISNAHYVADIQVSNNGSAASGVSTVFTCNSTSMINNGHANSSFNNTAMRTSSGSDAVYMPGLEGNPWCVFIESIGAFANPVYKLYTDGDSFMDGAIRFFGTLLIDDDATMEGGENFTLTCENAYLNTSAAAVGETFISKPGAMIGVIQDVGDIVVAVGGNSYASDNFSTDNWMDVGSKIVVDTTDSRLEYESERSSTDTRTYRDMGSLLSNEHWCLDYEWHPTSQTLATSRTFGFGMWSTNGNWFGYSGDAILVNSFTGTMAKIEYIDSGTPSDSSDNIPFSLNTTYYVRLEKTSTTNARLSMFSDSGYSSHIEGSPINFTIPATVTDLRFIKATNYNDNAGSSYEEIGWIDNVIFIDGLPLTADGISSGEKDSIVVSANTTHWLLYIDGVLEDSEALLSGLPDSAGNWTVGNMLAMPYLGSFSLNVDGASVCELEWEYTSGNFADASGYGNDGAPTYRTTSSDADVNANMTSYEPVSTAQAANVTASGTTNQALTELPDEPEGIWGSGDIGLPWADVLNDLLTEGGIPPQAFWYPVSHLIIFLGGLAMYKVRSLTLRATVIGLLMFLFARVNIYGEFVLIYYICEAYGALVMSKHFSW